MADSLIISLTMIEESTQIVINVIQPHHKSILVLWTSLPNDSEWPLHMSQLRHVFNFRINKFNITDTDSLLAIWTLHISNQTQILLSSKCQCLLIKIVDSNMFWPYDSLFQLTITNKHQFDPSLSNSISRLILAVFFDTTGPNKCQKSHGCSFDQL